MSKIEYCEVVEDNIKAVKDTEYFGGPNMWHLHIKTNNGWFESLQWMSVHSIQRFFTTKLPVYKDMSSIKYELEK
ncbi:MAG: hypothetical protein ACK5XN_39175 [Bacteroidota bacterium]|jgi:hypothetical protein